MGSQKWTCVSIILALCAIGIRAQRDMTFSLPESVLLFGDYNELWVVSPDWTLELHPPIDVKYNRGYFAFPSLAASGGSIAWGFSTEAWATRSENRIRFALGLYSTTDKKWTTHGEFTEIGDTAFTADGGRVAFVADANRKPRLVFFDVATERFSEGPYQRGMPAHANLSWSPDGTRVATEIERRESPSVLAVLDLGSGTLRELGEGFGARWSPTGEWIAYYTGSKCLLVHPDGTGVKEVMKLGRSRQFSLGSPVWSPDGKQLLLNVTKGDGPLLDVVLLDLATGGTTTKSSSGRPVFGWATYRPETRAP